MPENDKQGTKMEIWSEVLKEMLGAPDTSLENKIVLVLMGLAGMGEQALLARKATTPNTNYVQAVEALNHVEGVFGRVTPLFGKAEADPLGLMPFSISGEIRSVKAAFILSYFATHPAETLEEKKLSEADKEKIVEQFKRFERFLVKRIGKDAAQKPIKMPDFISALQDFGIGKELQRLLGYSVYPQGMASNLFYEVIGAGKGIGNLSARKRQINHAAKLKVVGKGKKRQINLIEGDAQIIIELQDIDKLFKGNNATAQKLFVLALIKANEQAIHDGKVTRNHISFPLQELVDMRFYGSVDTARRGFDAGADILTSLKIKGKIKSRNKDVYIRARSVLFTDSLVDNNQCFLWLNDKVDWNFIIQFYTVLPNFYFALNSKASALLEYIFYLARQRTREIKNEGHFNIGIRAIQNRLNLPSEVGNANPGRTILEPIENAAKQIEDKQKELGIKAVDLLFTHKSTPFECASVKSILENGYLQVTLSDEYAENFISISQKAEKRIETAQKRKERIIEKALVLNTAKKMEADEKAAKEEPAVSGDTD